MSANSESPSRRYLPPSPTNLICTKYSHRAEPGDPTMNPNNGLEQIAEERICQIWGDIKFGQVFTSARHYRAYVVDLRSTLVPAESTASIRHTISAYSKIGIAQLLSLPQMSAEYSPSKTVPHLHERLRPRVTQACDYCRMKKSKVSSPLPSIHSPQPTHFEQCDGQKPCSKCQSNNVVCAFTHWKKNPKIVYPTG
jgi:hypothetical protein